MRERLVPARSMDDVLRALLRRSERRTVHSSLRAIVKRLKFGMMDTTVLVFQFARKLSEVEMRDLFRLRPASQEPAVAFPGESLHRRSIGLMPARAE